MFLSSKSFGIVLLISVLFALVNGQETASNPVPINENSRPAMKVTLQEAQSRAAAGPIARVAELTTDAARYHRQAVEADYFPKISSSFFNVHFNKFMGETIQLARRTAAVPLINKDETILGFTVTQPLTPLFKVKQAVQLARADERIAAAKAAQMVAEVSSRVEQVYFAALIVQREEAELEQQVKVLQTELQIASTGEPPSLLRTGERQTAFLEASKNLVTARARASELMQPLNALLGLPPETELQLVIPEPVSFEPVSLSTALDNAMATSPELAEAEQTVVKARAAAKLGKLDYVPDVALIGGYYYQTTFDLLPSDFSFIGVAASFNVFDFGKREKTLKERQANVELAEMNLAAVRAKVGAGVQKTFLELERARRIRDLTRQLLLAYDGRLATTHLKVSTVDHEARVRAESEMLQAELDYRLAYAQLKGVVGGR